MTSKPINKREEDKTDNCMKQYINFQKCEELASKSKELHQQALYYNQTMEKYLAMANKAKTRAKDLEKQALYEFKYKELEEQIRSAWWEYNEFIDSSNIAECKAKALLKASCKLLQESQEYYSQSSSYHNIERKQLLNKMRKE